MGKTRAECSQNAYNSHASAFLSHWIQILANSSPKSDIKKKKKKKKTRPCFFAFYGRSGEGNITFFFFWPNHWTSSSTLSHSQSHSKVSAKALVTNTLANAVRTIFHHYVNGQKNCSYGVRKGICDQGFSCTAVLHSSQPGKIMPGAKLH